MTLLKTTLQLLLACTAGVFFDNDGSFSYARAARVPAFCAAAGSSVGRNSVDEANFQHAVRTAHWLHITRTPHPHCAAFLSTFVPRRAYATVNSILKINLCLAHQHRPVAFLPEQRACVALRLTLRFPTYFATHLADRAAARLRVALMAITTSPRVARALLRHFLYGTACNSCITYARPARAHHARWTYSAGGTRHLVYAPRYDARTLVYRRTTRTTSSLRRAYASAARCLYHRWTLCAASLRLFWFFALLVPSVYSAYIATSAFLHSAMLYALPCAAFIIPWLSFIVFTISPHYYICLLLVTRCVTLAIC